MSPRARTYDESDVRIRPNRRGSRPRTKDRPAHEDAIPGFVTGVDRGRYTLIVHAGGERLGGPVKARAIGRTRVVTGDEVAVAGDATRAPDARPADARCAPGRTALPGGGHAKLVAEIRNVMSPLAAAAIVHPGPGPDTTIGEERRTNPFLTTP